MQRHLYARPWVKGWHHFLAHLAGTNDALSRTRQLRTARWQQWQLWGSRCDTYDSPPSRAGELLRPQGHTDA